ncbi:MAG TPA: redoxin domain-containing protein, partial [Pedobacter sp.]|uniref:peroxiredoxin family protein n=1 Tax=Pedobacter sp. TaxID=1411316 RepID=UPI002C331BD1
TLKITKTAKGIEGNFTVPDSVLSFSIKPENNLRDVDEPLLFLVYKDGKPLPGALASAAVNYKRPDYNSNLQSEIARLLYRREFKLNPQLRAKYLLDYFESAAIKPDSLIIREINKDWRDSLQNAKNDRFLTRLYNLTGRFFWLTGREDLKAQLLAKYPEGDLAFAEARNELGKSGALYEQKLAEMERRFRSEYAKEGLDQIYSQRSRMELESGQLEKAAMYIRKIRSKYVLKQAYLNGANRLLSKGSVLDTAVSFVQKALDLYTYQFQPFTDQPYHLKDNGLKYIKSSQLDLYAQVLYAKGDLKGALQKIREARHTESSGVEVNEHYLKYLLEAGDYKSAFSVADSCLKADILSDPVKAAHRLSFLKLEPDERRYEQLYQRLTDSVNLAYQLPVYSKLNLKSIDFTLDNLGGQPFRLSQHKGKTVVLYFFNSKNNQQINLIWNNEFDKVYNEFKNRSDIVLVGIDRTPAFEADEASRTRSRMQVITQFVKTAGYHFPVLVDQYHHDSRNSGHCFFYMSDTYSAGSPGQFYVIDPKGIVRYKSYPVSNRTTAHNFTRELRAALKYGGS